MDGWMDGRNTNTRASLYARSHTHTNILLVYMYTYTYTCINLHAHIYIHMAHKYMTFLTRLVVSQAVPFRIVIMSCSISCRAALCSRKSTVSGRRVLPGEGAALWMLVGVFSQNGRTHWRERNNQEGVNCAS